MFKALLNSVVFLPILFGMLAATLRNKRQGLALLVAMLLLYDIVYVFLLYYLRIRWVG